MAVKNERVVKKPKKTPGLEFTESDLRQITLTKSQTEYLNLIINNQITFCYGPAGTSKTFTACLAALRLYLAGSIHKIILSKPICEAGERLGFLPGDIKDKIDPYMESYRSNLVELLNDPKLVSWLETMGVIEYRPLSYMRGTTCKNAIMILDEAQNATFKNLMLFVTRLGKNSKALVCGDVSQYDVEKNQVALPEFVRLMDGIPKLAIHKFNKTDIVRNDILIQVTERYEKWKEKNPEHQFLK